MSCTTHAKDMYESNMNMYRGGLSQPCTTQAKHMYDRNLNMYERDVTRVHTNE